MFQVPPEGFKLRSKKGRRRRHKSVALSGERKPVPAKRPSTTGITAAPGKTWSARPDSVSHGVESRDLKSHDTDSHPATPPAEPVSPPVDMDALTSSNQNRHLAAVKAQLDAIAMSPLSCQPSREKSRRHKPMDTAQASTSGSERASNSQSRQPALLRAARRWGTWSPVVDRVFEAPPLPQRRLLRRSSRQRNHSHQHSNQLGEASMGDDKFRTQSLGAGQQQGQRQQQRKGTSGHNQQTAHGRQVESQPQFQKGRQFDSQSQPPSQFQPRFQPRFQSQFPSQPGGQPYSNPSDDDVHPWAILLGRYRDWRDNMDVKFKIGFYVCMAAIAVVGLPAGTAVLFHQRGIAAAAAAAKVAATVGPAVGEATGGGGKAGKSSGNTAAGASGNSAKSSGAAASTAASTAASAAGVTGSANWGASTDALKTVTVYDENTQHVVDVPLNQYVENVLAYQLPPSTPMAALEATAVVVRTYAERAMSLPASDQTPAHAHHAQVTSSGITDLAWLTDVQQQTTFGSQYPVDVVRYRQAVATTDGIILTFQQKPIMAFLTAVSAGKTRSGTIALNQSVPYLQPVSCPADPTASGYKQTHAFTKAELAAELGVKGQQLDLAKFAVTKTDAQGYALQIQDAGHAWTGETFAALLQLPSADLKFAVSASGNQLDVTTKGEGSGLGMSLNQASAWAQSGESWQKLLHTFYPGARITPNVN